MKKWYNFDGHKLIYHMDRVYDYYRDGKPIAPIHIDIGATKLCNAKCIYCYGTYQKMTGESIPPARLIKLFTEAHLLGVKSITLTGDGEPTLNDGVWEAVTGGKLCGLDIGFATNGIALDEERLKVLLHACTWLRFNLSGVSKESYKSIHGVDRWERVQANIKLAVELKQKLGLKCTIGLQMVLVPQCFKEVMPEARFAVRTGVDYFVIKQFSDPGCKEMSQFALEWYDNHEVLETLRVAEGLSTKRTHVVPKWGMIASKGKRPYDRCVDCPLLFQVSGNGKCYPCGFLFGNDKYLYGDLCRQSLKEIINSKQYWDVINYMATEFNVHKDCQGCCRHDKTNEFVWKYLHPPEHLSFI